jgi:hypothetical protein
MAHFVSQSLPTSTRRGESAVVATVVKLASATDSFDLPRMAAASNSVSQLRRPGDAAITVSQTDVNTVSITGGSAGQEVLLVSLHNDPIVNG